MKKSEIKNYLNNFSKKQLIDELSSIIMSNRDLKEKYYILVNIDNKKQITDYVKDIEV
ncbi:hypothetical protein [Geotoga petraea]|jgi:hypothetical protein|uniref:hypothetical protein n=1 Tax=Geotoga petraea TaxID=28234 RepID=UPI00143682BD|nr:hypothetical protein [Geotoga petraea]